MFGRGRRVGKRGRRERIGGRPLQSGFCLCRSTAARADDRVSPPLLHIRWSLDLPVHQVRLGAVEAWMEGFILGVVEIVGAWRGDRFRVDELSVLGG